MVKISKNPGQCAGKKLFFFFIQKMAKIQDNVNPGHCEIRYIIYYFNINIYKC